MLLVTMQRQGVLTNKFYSDASGVAMHRESEHSSTHAFVEMPVSSMMAQAVWGFLGFARNDRYRRCYKKGKNPRQFLAPPDQRQ
jgi:hypothetical protein